ncbi:TetR/AcrR family transcriptional regulator [Cryptosporangium japonicum]|uniref:TetR/AcrR family transcriptional regulator n=1 Tax=Cryptosporangium japonicum TaxID=80872 RepID=A0ABP3EV68_9ACTN
MVRRQARGQQRITDILDAALALFAEVGYAAASTNAIAARAGISPGSLYQFFRNKEEIAQALSERLVTALGEAHAAAFAERDVVELPLEELVDRMTAPLIAFNVANPGAKVLFGSGDVPTGLAEATRPVFAAVAGRVTAVVAARAPALSAPETERVATVAVRIVAAMMPPIVGASGAERDALIAELHRALVGYLAPLESASGPTTSARPTSSANGSTAASVSRGGSPADPPRRVPAVPVRGGRG